MLRRLIGEDIQFTVRAPEDVGRVKAGSRTDRAGDHEPRVERAGRHAARRHARSDRRGRMRPARFRGRAASRSATRGGGSTPPRRPASSSRFSRRKQTGKGTGLGLSTASSWHRHAERRDHRGRQHGGPGVDVHGVPPARRRPHRSVVVPHTLASTRGSETILVVEDEEPVRSLIEKALRRQGLPGCWVGPPGRGLDIAPRMPAASICSSPTWCCPR